MIVGHYAAALVPYSKLEGRPLWLLLDLTPAGRGADWYPKLEYPQG